MPSAEAHVRTDRPSRYLVQLCRHADHMGRHRRTHADDAGEPPTVRNVAWTESRGTVELDRGRWTLLATPNTLTLHAEAADEDDLLQLQALLAHRLEQIGRRDHLTVTWQHGDPPTPPDDLPEAAEAPSRGKRRAPAAAWLVGALAVLVVAAHVGLGGAAIAASSWTLWTTLGLGAVLLLKLIVLRVLATRRHTITGTARHILGRFRHRTNHDTTVHDARTKP